VSANVGELQATNVFCVGKKYLGFVCLGDTHVGCTYWIRWYSHKVAIFMHELLQNEFQVLVLVKVDESTVTISGDM